MQLEMENFRRELAEAQLKLVYTAVHLRIRWPDVACTHVSEAAREYFLCMHVT